MRFRRRGVLLFAFLAGMGSASFAEEGGPTGLRASAIKIEVSPAKAQMKGLLRESKIEEAETFVKDNLAGTRARWGTRSLEYAAALDLAVECQNDIGAGRYEASIEMAKEAVAIREELLGPAHYEVGLSLRSLGFALTMTNQYERAKAVLDRARSIIETTLGPEHSELAAVFHNLGNLMYMTGKYDQAGSFYAREVPMYIKTYGPVDSRVASALYGLALASYGSGDFTATIEYAGRALAVYEKVHPPGHPAIADARTLLAGGLIATGRYAEAEAALAAARASVIKALGPEHPKVLPILISLADLCLRSGALARGLSFAKDAGRICEKTLGIEHPFMTGALKNEGRLSAALGKYEEGLERLTLARSLEAENRGSSSERFAQILDDIGNVRRLKGDLDGAESVLREALSVREKLLGQDSERTGASLANVGEILIEKGELDQADSLLRRVLAIDGRPEHRDNDHTIQHLKSLGDIAFLSADYHGATLRYEQARTLCAKLFGEEHPEMAVLLADLARVALAEGSGEKALASALQAEELGRRNLRLTISALSEYGALRYRSMWRAGRDMLLSAVALAPGMKASRRIEAWEALARSRGMVFEEIAYRHRGSMRSGDPEIRGLSAAVEAARSRLAHLLVRGSEGLPAQQYRQLLEGARNDVEQGEEDLARRRGAFRQELKSKELRFEDALQSLPPKTALVSFVEYGKYESRGQKTQPVAADGLQTTGSSHISVAKPVASYAALVVPASSRTPEFVPLGEAAHIERLVLNWREEIVLADRDPWRSAEEAEAASREAGRALRAIVWDPLGDLLRGADRIFVIPDGALHLVSFAALPMGKRRYVIDEGRPIHYLCAERDLLLEESDRTNEKILAIGAPDYDALEISLSSSPAVAQGDKPVSAAAGEPPFSARRSACRAFQSLRFPLLPETGTEVEELAALCRSAKRENEGPRKEARRSPPERSVRILRGKDATEQAVKAEAPGKSIVHLATHAFLLEGGCPSMLDSDSDPRHSSLLLTEDRFLPGKEDPLLLSGLALAGANYHLSARAGGEDGILTTAEIVSLDLSEADWVVLSACDTGVGAIVSGEGVFGLRRAFRVAGARTLLMSLWPIEDRAARRWIKALYAARLEQGLSTAESVHNAGLTLLRRLRSAGRSTHPYYWAGLVAEGDWR